MPDARPVGLSLSFEEAEALHAVLEDLLETGAAPQALERVHRLLAWQTLAATKSTGLTARLAEIARQAKTLEQYESDRDDELGPILDGLERPENRDP